MKTIDGARVYRFHGGVAINIDTDGAYTSSLYLDPDMAMLLANLLLETALDIHTRNFVDSELGTRLVVKDEESPVGVRVVRE